MFMSVFRVRVSHASIHRNLFTLIQKFKWKDLDKKKVELKVLYKGL